MTAEQRHPWLTVDGLLLLDGKLVCVRRGRDPFAGRLALPGGFVELGETVQEAVVREVREETGLETRVRRLVGVYSDPKRDPRGHTVSVAFELEPIGGRIRASDDAAEVVLVDPDHPPELAFDHATIVRDWRTH
jgi:8-oxo-dGTP diphosphatase